MTVPVVEQAIALLLAIPINRLPKSPTVKIIAIHACSSLEEPE